MSATIKTWLNNQPPTVDDDDLNGFKTENNNLIVGSGQTLNTGDLQQTNKAVAHYASAGQIYVDSGAANAYVLSAGNSRANIPAYVDRAKFLFVPDNPSTGASTVNIGGLGVKNLKDENGDALITGSLITTKETIIEYILSSDEFRIVGSPDIPGYVKGMTEYLEDDSGGTSGFFDIVASITPSTFESVGPTGSGATNIYPSLDDAPVNSQFFKLKVSLSVLGSTNGDVYSLDIYARKTGSSTSFLNRTAVATTGFTNRSGLSESNKNSAPFEVPVDSLNRFDIGILVSGTAVGAGADLTYKGACL